MVYFGPGLVIRGTFEQSSGEMDIHCGGSVPRNIVLVIGLALVSQNGVVSRIILMACL